MSSEPLERIEDHITTGPDFDALKEVENRVLWLATQMVHHANNVRPNEDGSKVGGHQASSASVVSILTALYFDFLRAGDRVSIKPHASPVFHATQYLLGELDKSYLPTLREFGGLQAYPSRTKDPDPVDFSTGSVGLGAVAPVYAALASKYAEMHFGRVNSDRFIALIGDAELDEGNVWETVAEEAIRGLDNVIWIVDLNRQSLDRVIPGVRASRLKALFAGAGWHVFEAKYGTELTAAMSGPGGEGLRRRIDDMSNEEYQALIRIRDGAELRKRMTDVVDPAYRESIRLALEATPDEQLQPLIANLGGHDLPRLLEVLHQADAVQDGPAVVFAYTVKGHGLPIAGDPLNHSQLLSQRQLDELAVELDIEANDPWAVLPAGSAGARIVQESAERLRRVPIQTAPMAADAIPDAIDTRHPAQTSTQEALGRSLARLADYDDLRDRIITMSPDVATSTHLSGWINKAGVFAVEQAPEYEVGAPKMLKWNPSPEGHHIELGISEMNLFMALGQFGLAEELTGQHLIPIGTVYDPFVCRGLDALIYSLYCGAKMIFAGTPAGVSLSPEGGAHQSTITPSIGIELPDVVLFEPAFAKEVEWILIDAMRSVSDRARGHSTYLRLSTKPVDQGLMTEAMDRLGEEAIRTQTLAGGYRIIDRTDGGRDANHDVVNIFSGGIMVAEAMAASERLLEEGVRANVINTTSIDSLYKQVTSARAEMLANARRDQDLGHLETLIPKTERRAPIVSVIDGASHSMSFLGSVYGVPVVPLGVDEFGQSGSREALYRKTGISTDDIINASMLALDLAQDG